MSDPLKVQQATSAVVTFDHTIPTSRTRVPSEHVFTSLAVLAALFCIGAGIVIGRYQGAVTVTRTVHVHQTVAQVLGKPDDSGPADQLVNATIAGRLGIQTCDWYAQKHTVVCHP